MFPNNVALLLGCIVLLSSPGTHFSSTFITPHASFRYKNTPLGCLAEYFFASVCNAATLEMTVYLGTPAEEKYPSLRNAFT